MYKVSHQPLLSVIIPALNEAETLPLLLGDLRRQQGLRLEVLIGDGGSTDGTRQVAERCGARCIVAPLGRGAQMNAAAREAAGDFLLFLHADSRLDDPHLLANGLIAMQQAMHSSPQVAGHFRLRFMRSRPGNALSYRYIEAKTVLNRTNTTNGDQGMLLPRDFFRQLGGFDERLPFLEDQRLAETIRGRGAWITLPGELRTSARRFESEGFHRRYLLMGLMMVMHATGQEEFFRRAPGIYRMQPETGQLVLSPFFDLIRAQIRHDWSTRQTARIFFRIGRYLRENAWQPFFFLDVCLRPLLGAERSPLLWTHDRLIAPCLRFRAVDALFGLLSFCWFLGVIAPVFRLLESSRLRHNQGRG